MRTDPTEDYERGFVPFLDCKIFLDSHPLIPRVETEYWVEKAIEEMRAAALSRPRVLDLFAGSGAIGAAILKHLPESRVDFGEIDAAHFPTILKNIRENRIDEKRAKIIETDVWSTISDTYDFVLANPPYLSKTGINRVQKSVLLHEPGKALFADEDGFALIRRTIAGAKPHLAPGGLLYIEHEPEQRELTVSSAKTSGFLAETRKDQYGVFRFSVLKAQPYSATLTVIAVA